jgi:hypothetical protein
MPYQATIHNVMIASPSDVTQEKNIVCQALAEWNVIHSESRKIVLLPISWDTHSSPQMGQHPQKILNQQLLSRSDLLVGIFWTRIGTPTPTHPSGSVEEIEEHIDSEKPTMLYFSKQPVSLDSVDNDQYKRLKGFINRCKQRGLLEEYDDLDDFREKFFRQLQLKLNDPALFLRPVLANEVNQSAQQGLELSQEAKTLLLASAENDGTLLVIEHLGGTDVCAGGRNFVEGDDRRSAAKWKAAVNELEREQLIEDTSHKGQCYSVTHYGYAVADSSK